MANQAVTKPSLIQGHSAFFGMQAASAPAPNGGAVGVVISELAHQGKLNIRCDKSLHKKLNKIVGIETELANNHFASTRSRYAIWLSPDEMMILTGAGEEAELAAHITTATKGAHMAVTDITDAMTSLHLSGASVRQMLAKGCAIDLHKDYFKAGQCAQTTLSHAAVTLLALADDEMILLCRTSFTDYVVNYLCDASLEYGFTLKA